MNIIIGALFLAVGFLGVLNPNFFFKSEKLNSSQIERNRRIWRRCGIGLLVIGATLMAFVFLWKGE